MSQMEEKHITQLLIDLEPIVKSLNGLFAANRVSYNSARWDLENLAAKKKMLLDEMPAIEKSNADKRRAADVMIEKARAQAEKIMEVAGHRNVESIRLLSEVKQFVTDVEKARYKELSAKVA